MLLVAIGFVILVIFLLSIVLVFSGYLLRLLPISRQCIFYRFLFLLIIPYVPTYSLFVQQPLDYCVNWFDSVFLSTPEVWSHCLACECMDQMPETWVPEAEHEREWSEALTTAWSRITWGSSKTKVIQKSPKMILDYKESGSAHNNRMLLVVSHVESLKSICSLVESDTDISDFLRLVYLLVGNIRNVAYVW